MVLSSVYCTSWWGKPANVSGASMSAGYCREWWTRLLQEIIRSSPWQSQIPTEMFTARPLLYHLFLLLLHWRGSNRWRGSARGWWERKKCNIYSSASLLSRCSKGRGEEEEEESKLVGARTRAPWASFTSQSALIKSTSCRGSAGSLSVTPTVLTPPLVSPPVPTVGVNFYFPFTACLPPSL